MHQHSGGGEGVDVGVDVTSGVGVGGGEVGVATGVFVGRGGLVGSGVDVGGGWLTTRVRCPARVGHYHAGDPCLDTVEDLLEDHGNRRKVIETVVTDGGLDQDLLLVVGVLWCDDDL